MKFSYEVSAMNCNIGGVMYSCPTFMDDKSKMFCCKVNENIGGVEVCCDAGDFLRENTGIVIGIAVGALLYKCPVVTPYSTTYPPLSSTYQVVGPPPSQFSNPPPYYPSASPSYNYAYQPPENPSYK
ncbi:uncharacterized protein TNIN_395993 [Trichonephila inaurata madagascariensis]|uniref:Uncharacterized protein n=1 Tax=Trichonephila inaurata madagascariensis TaxID=2747483 RepID=A0A8X6WSQ4_9ARAC|nr:uncharacterized protein TNIN_395993 [Trichonephila inaurata madagascariensis]